MDTSFLAFVAFVAMWIGVMALLSHMSGWPKLAAVYRARRPPSGRCFLFARGKVGEVWFNGCLTIYTSPEGLYLSVWPIFRFREPPLFIPWSEVRDRRETRWLWWRLIEFNVGSPTVGTIRLGPGVFRDAPNV